MRMINIIIAVILLLGNAAFADYKAGKAAYDAGDYQTAYNEWLPLAEAGDAKAAHNIGLLYSKGEGVKLNWQKAQYWYLIADIYGYSTSQINIAKILLSGKLLKVYIKEGLCWIYKANKLNDQRANFIISYYKSNGVPVSVLNNAKNMAKGKKCSILPLP